MWSNFDVLGQQQNIPIFCTIITLGEVSSIIFFSLTFFLLRCFLLLSFLRFSCCFFWHPSTHHVSTKIQYFLHVFSRKHKYCFVASASKTTVFYSYLSQYHHLTNPFFTSKSHQHFFLQRRLFFYCTKTTTPSI